MRTFQVYARGKVEFQVEAEDEEQCANFVLSHLDDYAGVDFDFDIEEVE